jgi:hypothetical protein
MNPELRMLKIAVPNPGYDKRRKSGPASVEMFDQGERFVLEYYPSNHGVLSDLPATATFVGPKSMIVVDSIAVRLLFASSCIAVPTTFDDLLALNKVDAYDTIKQLLEDGALTIPQITKAHLKILKRLEEEKAKSTPSTPVSGSVS